MKLYVGSRDYKPEGFLSVDIDPQWNPDIVGDITHLDNIQDESVDEIIASHVLEHLAWPDSFVALCEFQRILKPEGVLQIAIPDAGLLAELISSKKSSWHAMGLLFGVGRIFNKFEAHQFSYTLEMMTDLLNLLGFSEFEHWNSDVSDASNGWQPIIDGARIAILLNIKSKKVRAPLVSPDELKIQFRNSMLSAVEEIIQRAAQNSDIQEEGNSSRILFQSLHFQLIDARQRIKYLEKQKSSSLALFYQALKKLFS